MSTRSLNRRLLLALVLPLGILLTLGGAASYGLAQYFADTVYDGWLFDSVNSLSLEVESTPTGPFVDMPAPTQRLFEWDLLDKTYFRITGSRKGHIAGRVDMPAMAGDVDPYQGVFFYDLLADIGSIFDERPESNKGALIYDGRLDKQDVRVARLALPESQFGETVTLEVAETTRKRQALAIAILLGTLAPQLVLTVVALAAIRRAIAHGLDPLNLISKRLHSRSYQDLSPVDEAGVPVEVLPLTRSLNDLLGRLSSAQTAQRRFIADAAHQLRTPLTAIKLQVDEAAREDTIEGAHAILLSLQASADRAVRLSNQLLSLARAEPEAQRAKAFQKVDLASLAQETGGEWAPRALSHGIEMQFASDAGEQAIYLDGDTDLLREAIGNLLDNAIKYQRSQGLIHIRVEQRPYPSIVIDDAGPGIPQDLRSQMLRRFVRGERGEGTGLGLSIAQEIARLHGGELLLEDRPDSRGLRVRLSFPISKAGDIKPSSLLGVAPKVRKAFRRAQQMISETK
jgi:two-component system, OmpR family, sensor histidine kinase TctE